MAVAQLWIVRPRDGLRLELAGLAGDDLGS